MKRSIFLFSSAACLALIIYACGASTSGILNTVNNVITSPTTGGNSTVPGLSNDEIISGLKSGEIVVVSGAYLINSEYVFKRGMMPMGNMGGMKMDEMKNMNMDSTSQNMKM